MSKTATKNCITLTGSAAIIKDYLSELTSFFKLLCFEIPPSPAYGVNSILFQRGIYPAETFNPIQQYGLTILMSKDEKIKEFLKNVLGKAEGWLKIWEDPGASLIDQFPWTEWLAQNKVEKFSLIVSNVHSKEVLECWDFKVDAEPLDQNESPNPIDPNTKTSSKELKKIQGEIGAVMRQIAATISYLPLLECVCSFDLLIHCEKELDIPTNWNETDGISIKNSQVVNLKAFSTGLHKVETVVSYRMSDD